MEGEPLLCSLCGGSGAIIKSHEDSMDQHVLTCPRCKGGCFEPMRDPDE